MMKKTHLTIGIASAVAITHPEIVSECFVAIMGGAIGGVICDIDILDNDYKNNDFFERFLVVKMTGIILLLDFLLQTGICEAILNRDKRFLLIGGVLFSVLCLIGIHSAHRTFTHSFIALILFSAALSLIYPPIVYSFIIGFLSHLMLDLLNKKKIRLFYPSDFGLCFGLCYANKIANTIFMYIGTIATVLLVLNGLFFHLW